MEFLQFEKCCGCVPPKFGLMAYGFIKLIAYTLTGVFFFASFAMDSIVINSIVCCVLLMVSTFLILLLIGTHINNYHLFRMYYRYGVALAVVMSALFLFDIAACIYKFSTQTVSVLPQHIVYIVATYICFAIDLFIEYYVLLLVRGQLDKLKGTFNLKFVNVKVDESLPEADRDGTIGYDRFEEDIQNFVNN